MADKKKEVYDEDLESIVNERQRTSAAIWTLDAIQISCGQPLTPTATLTMTGEDGAQTTVVAYGTGPVDAAYKAIDQVVGVGADLAEFSVSSVTRGIDALGEVTVRVVAADGRVYIGRGSDGDIIVSSALAYINALNRLIADARDRSGN